MTTSKTMTATDYAKLRGKPKAWASRRIAAGLPAEKVGNEYRIRPARAIDWEIATAVDDAKRVSGSARERLANEQADHAALKNARERGELIYADQVAESLAWLGAELAARLDAVPGRLAGELAGITDPAIVRRRLFEEHRGVRSAVAEAGEKLADILGSAEDAGEQGVIDKQRPRAS